jgi:glycerophosphoryl diester phosphodiesterase
MQKKFTRKLDIFILLLIITALSCNKSIDVPAEMASQTPVDQKEEYSTATQTVKFLGHKGAGSNNYNDVNMEHSIASFVEALKVLDGVEVDMQMSLDGTIWLFHDIDINRSLCTIGAPRSILTMHDKEIAQLKLCSRTKKDRVYKLSELIDLWNTYPNGFYISMEIKEDFETETYNAVGGRSAYLKRFAEKLAAALKVLKHAPQQFLIEEDDRIFPDAFRKYPIGREVKYYVFEYKSFDKVVADALSMGFDGVSCNFTDKTITAAKIKAAQNKGLKVQLWTPYYDSEVLKVYNMHPDFIQTDHTNVKSDLGIK